MVDPSIPLTGSATLSTQSGFFLWVGNNPYTFSYYPIESIDSSQDAASAALSSQEISEQPRNNEALVFERLWMGWLPSPRRSFWPSLVHALSYGPIMIFGLWGMWANRRHWREHSIFYQPCSSAIPVTGLIWMFTGSYLAGALAAWLTKSPYRKHLEPAWQRAADGLSPHASGHANHPNRPRPILNWINMPPAVQRIGIGTGHQRRHRESCRND